jgi:hypothetical protein
MVLLVAKYPAHRLSAAIELLSIIPSKSTMMTIIMEAVETISNNLVAKIRNAKRKKPSRLHKALLLLHLRVRTDRSSLLSIGMKRKSVG